MFNLQNSIFTTVVVLFYLGGSLPKISCQIVSVEDPDGSYSIGYDSVGRGNTGESVLALLAGAAGWTNQSLANSLLNSRGAVKLPPSRDLELHVRRFLTTFSGAIRRIASTIRQWLINSITSRKRVDSLNRITVSSAGLFVKILEIVNGILNNEQLKSVP